MLILKNLNLVFSDKSQYPLPIPFDFEIILVLLVAYNSETNPAVNYEMLT